MSSAMLGRSFARRLQPVFGSTSIGDMTFGRGVERSRVPPQLAADEELALLEVHVFPLERLATLREASPHRSACVIA